MGYLEVPQTEQDTTSTDKPVTKCLENISEIGYKCVCLNARSIVNKKNELNIMVEDTDPHIIGITFPSTLYCFTFYTLQMVLHFVMMEFVLLVVGNKLLID